MLLFFIHRSLKSPLLERPMRYDSIGCDEGRFIFPEERALAPLGLSALKEPKRSGDLAPREAEVKLKVKNYPALYHLQVCTIYRGLFKYYIYVVYLIQK